MDQPLIVSGRRRSKSSASLCESTPKVQSPKFIKTIFSIRGSSQRYRNDFCNISFLSLHSHLIGITSLQHEDISKECDTQYGSFGVDGIREGTSLDQLESEESIISPSFSTRNTFLKENNPKDIEQRNRTNCSSSNGFFQEAKRTIRLLT